MSKTIYIDDNSSIITDIDEGDIIIGIGRMGRFIAEFSKGSCCSNCSFSIDYRRGLYNENCYHIHPMLCGKDPKLIFKEISIYDKGKRIQLHKGNKITLYKDFNIGDILIGVNGVDEYEVKEVSNGVNSCNICDFKCIHSGNSSVNCSCINYKSCRQRNGAIFKKIDYSEDRIIDVKIPLSKLKSSICNEDVCIYYSEKCTGDGKLCIFRKVIEAIKENGE